MKSTTMHQYLTFEREELLNNMEFVSHAIQNMDQIIVQMEEQGLGRRSDLDWEYVAARLREYIEDFRTGMTRFDVDVDFTAKVQLRPRRETEITLHNNEPEDLPF